MEKSELFKIMQENPVMYLATSVDNQPHVRAVLLYRADENGIIFHTGKMKDLFNQLQTNPSVELCFYAPAINIQIRVEGKMELVDDLSLKQEIINHPSRVFMKDWVKKDPELSFFTVFRMKNGKAHVWTFADNFLPKKYVTL